MEEEIHTIEEDAIISGVASLNGQTGDLNIKTVNNQSLLGTGNINIEAGVTSVNGQTGNVTLVASDIGAASEGDLQTLETTVSGKQSQLSASQLDAVNSGIDATKVGQIATNATNIATIDGKIPTQASSSNQLADKNFVNSSVATNTANYISDNGQPFSSLADLEAYSGTLTNNDYAFVVGTDSAGNTTYTRYKYNSTTGEWAEEYVLNNSSFTAGQWDAINSGITSSGVTKLGGIEAGAEVNDIDSISVNGTAVTPDANKNVDITVPTPPTVVQTTGQSTTSVMSQNAVTSMVYADPGDKFKLQIGGNATAAGGYSTAVGLRTYAGGSRSIAIGTAYGNNASYQTRASGAISIAIGEKANTANEASVAIGSASYAGAAGSIALGAGSSATSVGQFDIGTSNTGYGYNSTNYRLLSGVHDPQSAHDAATKGYVDGLVGNIESALNVINNGSSNS